MPSQQIDAVLKVEDEQGDLRALQLPGDLSADRTGAASEITAVAAAETLVAVLSELRDVLAADVTDRPGRQVGHVTVDNPTAAPETGLSKETTQGSVLTRVGDVVNALAGVVRVNVTDSAARLLGRVTVDNLPATQAVSAAALPLPLGAARASDIQDLRAQLPNGLDDDGSLRVADVFTAGEVLPDQVGAGAALTSTYTAPVDLVWVRAIGGRGRTNPFAGAPAPTATAGIPCADDEPTPITVRTSTVKVFAPTGVTVAVWGFRS